MKIILYQPEIPQNTGNIIRTCSATGGELLLVPPYKFSLSSRHLKRSGLDYYSDVNITEIDDLEKYLSATDSNFYFFSSHATTKYTDVSYNSNDILIFGSETKGLPQHYFTTWPDRFVTIPMKKKCRCLNLSNSVAVSIYEVIRQTNA